MKKKIKGAARKDMNMQRHVQDQFLCAVFIAVINKGMMRNELIICH